MSRSPLRSSNPPSLAMASRFATCWVVPIRPVAPLIMTPISRSVILGLHSPAPVNETLLPRAFQLDEGP